MARKPTDRAELDWTDEAPEDALGGVPGVTSEEALLKLSTLAGASEEGEPSRPAAAGANDAPRTAERAPRDRVDGRERGRPIIVSPKDHTLGSGRH